MLLLSEPRDWTWKTTLGDWLQHRFARTQELWKSIKMLDSLWWLMHPQLLPHISCSRSPPANINFWWFYKFRSIPSAFDKHQRIAFGYKNEGKANRNVFRTQFLSASWRSNRYRRLKSRFVYICSELWKKSFVAAFSLICRHICLHKHVIQLFLLHSRRDPS